MNLDLPLALLCSAVGLGAALYALRLANHEARRHLRDPDRRPVLRRAFGIMALAMVGYALALPAAIVWLPAGAQIGVIMALSGGFAWTLAAQALRLRALVPLPAVARTPRPAEAWAGLGATLVGLGLALAAALSGGLIVAFR